MTFEGIKTNQAIEIVKKKERKEAWLPGVGLIFSNSYMECGLE